MASAATHKPFVKAPTTLGAPPPPAQFVPFPPCAPSWPSLIPSEFTSGHALGQLLLPPPPPLPSAFGSPEASPFAPVSEPQSDDVPPVPPIAVHFTAMPAAPGFPAAALPPWSDPFD